jgi:hypothetical protein
MPGFNQKGPMGQGPMTGRRMGRCTNYGAAAKNDIKNESENQTQRQPGDFPGRGFGPGRGRGGKGRGMGRQNRIRGDF